MNSIHCLELAQSFSQGISGLGKALRLILGHFAPKVADAGIGFGYQSEDILGLL
jgi:hypothetical protein